MWALIPTALAFIAAMAMSKERLSSSVEHQQAMDDNNKLEFNKEQNVGI
jgi:hypothetical protein